MFSVSGASECHKHHGSMKSIGIMVKLFTSGARPSRSKTMLQTCFCEIVGKVIQFPVTQVFIFCLFLFFICNMAVVTSYEDVVFHTCST